MPVLETVALAMLIVRGIGVTAEAARGIRDIKTAKKELWGDVSKKVNARLADPEIQHADDIRWVQESLNALGEKLAVDGDEGPATKEAVKRFQKTHNLEVDGEAGILTCSAMINALRVLQVEQELDV